MGGKFTDWTGVSVTDLFILASVWIVIAGLVILASVKF